MPSILSILLSLIKPIYDFYLHYYKSRSPDGLVQFPALTFSLQTDEESVWLWHWSLLGWTVKGHSQCKCLQNRLQTWGMSESKENKKFKIISHKIYMIQPALVIASCLCPDYHHCQGLHFHIPVPYTDGARGPLNLSTRNWSENVSSL